MKLADALDRLIARHERDIEGYDTRCRAQLSRDAIRYAVRGRQSLRTLGMVRMRFRCLGLDCRG